MLTVPIMKNLHQLREKLCACSPRAADAQSAKEPRRDAAAQRPLLQSETLSPPTSPSIQTTRQQSTKPFVCFWQGPRASAVQLDLMPWREVAQASKRLKALSVA